MASRRRRSPLPGRGRSGARSGKGDSSRCRSFPRPTGLQRRRPAGMSINRCQPGPMRSSLRALPPCLIVHRMRRVSRQRRPRGPRSRGLPISSRINSAQRWASRLRILDHRARQVFPVDPGPLRPGPLRDPRPGHDLGDFLGRCDAARPTSAPVAGFLVTKTSSRTNDMMSPDLLTGISVSSSPVFPIWRSSPSRFSFRPSSRALTQESQPDPCPWIRLCNCQGRMQSPRP